MSIQIVTTKYISDGSDEWSRSLFETWINKSKAILDKAFGSPQQFNLSIYISENYNYPVCWSDRPNTRINLALKDLTHWAKVVYQFSHEYCHAVINSPYTPEQLRDEWFEEVICECASRYVLYRLNEDPLAKQIYKDFFKEYSNELFLKKNAKKIDAKELLIEGSPLQHEVRNNHEDRPVFNYLANEIYPIITANPIVWESVPLLAKFKDSNTFQQNLEQWKTTSCNKSQPLIQQIIDLFS